MSRTVTEARKYDHIYDNLYSTNSAKDYYRDAQRVMYSNVEKVPHRKNMFSDVGHFPSYQFRLKANKDIPEFVSQEFRGVVNDAVPANMVEAITGSHRPKYFHRPIVPFLNAVPPEIVLEGESSKIPRPSEEDPALAERIRKQAEEDGIVVSNGKRTIAVQTVYRDSEAQTNPYTPQYLLSEAEPNPEILAIAHLNASNFPPTNAEMLEIERMRQKRTFEHCLPPMTDEASFAVRRQLMEAQETLQLEWKERAMDERNDAKLSQLAAALERRDKERDFVMEQRLEDLQRKLLDSKDSSMTSIQKKRIQALRKLGKTREKAESQVDMLTGTGLNAALGGRGKKRDIIGDYANFSSEVYAPLTRNGRILDKTKPQLENAVKGTADVLLSAPAQVAALEQSMPRKLTQSVMPRLGDTGTATLSMTKNVGGKEKRMTGREAREVADDVARVEAILKTAKLAESGEFNSTSKAELPAWRHPKEHVVRPPTPTFADIDGSTDIGSSTEGDDVELAVLLLQKLIRGRAVQNIMHEGKGRRADLIAELKIALEPVDDGYEASQALQAKQRDHEAATVASVQGEVVASTLDFLSKELVRMTEQKKIAEIAFTAERTRRLREGEEGGRRQAEGNLRAKQDVVYKQLHRVHSQAAESFVDGVLSASVERCASESALIETKMHGAFVGPTIDRLELRNGVGVVVKDLVASFLLPEVERRQVQAQVELEEKKYVDAARKTILSAISDVESASKK